MASSEEKNVETIEICPGCFSTFDYCTSESLDCWGSGGQGDGVVVIADEFHRWNRHGALPLAPPDSD